ncbi:MAG TPA: hypothetical protein VE153_31130, partial [Myxococcus sp.]|nr:hypothetical protein [Myxococcus sp.]
LHPDYHPAGAFLVASTGPLQAELFTSDVLAARLVGAEVGVSALAGRAGLSLSVAHDFGASEARSPPVTLVHTDASVALLMRKGLEVHVLGGAGVRPQAPGLAWGALAGLAVETLSDTLELGGRLEARVRRGGFQQGFFGPDYELSRLQAPGAVAPVAQTPFPEGYSFFGELVVGWDGLHLDHAQRRLQLSVAAEVSGSGRVDADARVTGWLARRRVGVALAALAVGVGQPGARGALSGEVRWYLGRRLYALAQGGTRFFPTGGAIWRTGAFLAMGLGAEYAR